MQIPLLLTVPCATCATCASWQPKEPDQEGGSLGMGRCAGVRMYCDVAAPLEDTGLSGLKADVFQLGF